MNIKSDIKVGKTYINLCVGPDHHIKFLIDDVINLTLPEPLLFIVCLPPPAPPQCLLWLLASACDHRLSPSNSASAIAAATCSWSHQHCNVSTGRRPSYRATRVLHRCTYTFGLNCPRAASSHHFRKRARKAFGMTVAPPGRGGERI